MVHRYKITLEYDGGFFYGFQLQEGFPTIQGCVEEALYNLFQKKVRLFGAGRTDKGVHALGQVAHFDLDHPWYPEKLKLALNHFLRQERISIIQVESVDEKFHARFSAKNKLYQYRIINRNAHLALDNNRAWHVGNNIVLKPDIMHLGAKILEGHHDFSSFRDSDCQSLSPFKTIFEAKVESHGQEIIITFQGKSFLHHQVRNMAGTLKLLGQGKISLWDLE
jgi:tRNA pseudouridine38-40 synthase